MHCLDSEVDFGLPAQFISIGWCFELLRGSQAISIINESKYFHTVGSDYVHKWKRSTPAIRKSCLPVFQKTTQPFLNCCFIFRWVSVKSFSELEKKSSLHWGGSVLEIMWRMGEENQHCTSLEAEEECFSCIRKAALTVAMLLKKVTHGFTSRISYVWRNFQLTLSPFYGKQNHM